MSPGDHLLSDFLGELELAEARLLSWGLVDGFAIEQELIDRADDFIVRSNGWDHFPNGRALIDTMLERRLLFQWNSGEVRCRSRFAETLRLLARLRQLFPKHLQTTGAWLTAPTLVADFRFLLRARSYPRRDLSAPDAIAMWSEPDGSGRVLTPLQKEVLEGLIGIDDGAHGFALAGFQVRATRRILALAGSGGATGTVVCAGTGSGKTLAFYLPALANIAGSIEQDATHWTRALALYPRKELLKDQFTECCRLLRNVNAVLRRHRRRPLIIATLYGDTPKNAGHAGEAEGWRATSGGRICPFLACPAPDCSGSMVWRDEDRKRGVERLQCAVCNGVVADDEIALTRQRIGVHPPDLLFTTTEMLNRRLSDTRQWHLFGVGMPAARKPVMMLLDEAHTYSGLHGAQVAYLLRRWRHRAGCAPHIVGLSATLMEAPSFFAQLTGLPDHLVEEVSPESAEMIYEGMEYLVAVRGDPVSGASLLSTTIQTSMLLRRALDPTGEAVSYGFYGSKLFVFTDNLDVTNRLYFNLLDAEGLGPRGRPDPVRHPDGPLAGLRASTHPGARARYNHGQSWDLCEGIGHSLRDTTLRLGRVSSQDAGVDASAEMIVATAALEVGFNDPDVGAVLQHKAPHDAATFLQRKGRAGRRREMRPWLVVVLSDYGRDRLAYSGYDLLFDPELRPRDLPLRNRHVLKMQAVYACLDWLATQMPPGSQGQMWSDASCPGSENQPGWRETSRQRQTAAADVLADVLRGGDAFDRLQDYLGGALRLPNTDDVQQLLWEPPRAILTAALPTLLRRLRHDWLARDETAAEFHHRDHPLPEFIPATLFSDLNLPEIFIWASLRPGEEPESSPLPAAQALREFAPGRISRRFGIWHRLSRHWIAVDPAKPLQSLDIDAFCGPNDRESLGQFQYRQEDGTIAAIHVLRPYALRVRADAPKTIGDSSNAFLKWRSQILPPGSVDPGVAADLPARSRWSDILQEMRFFTHQLNQPARLRRFALGSQAEIRFTGGNTSDVESRFALGDEPVGLGFAFETDAARVTVRIPGQWKVRPETLRGLRVAYFRARVAEDARFDGLANSFDRQWLAEIALSALSATAIAMEVPLPEAWMAIRAGESTVSLPEVLEVIFQSVPADPDAESDEAVRMEQRRHQEISRLLLAEPVVATLDALMPLLWEPLDDGWNAWLQERFLATLGAAFQNAINQLCPDLDSEDLLVDIDGGAPAPEEPPTALGMAALWLTESAPGGGGVIERFLPRMADDPRRFLDLLAGELAETDFEVADAELMRLLDMLVTGLDAGLSDAVDAVRAAPAQQELVDAFTHLRGILHQRGIFTSHPVVAAIAARVLRPGSRHDTDILLRETMMRWRAEEARLGIEIEVRALAYALSTSETLDAALGGDVAVGPGQNRRQWRFSTLCGLLWPRGSQARNHGLALHNSFATIPPAERLLVLDALGPEDPEIPFGSDDWHARLEATLAQNSRAILAAEAVQLTSVRHALLALIVNPVDTGTLLLYPRLRGLFRQRSRIVVPLDLTAPGQIAPGPPEDPQLPVTARLIVKTMRGSRDEVRDLIESLLATELLAPGDDLWLVSPWITDIPLLDNRSGAYVGLDPSWPKRHLGLAELLAFALKFCPSTCLRVVTRPDPHNRRFCERLQTLAALDLTVDRLHIDNSRQTLHVKGLAGSSFALKGSMNFTRNGIEVLEETVELETDSRRVAQLLLNFATHYQFAS